MSGLDGDAVDELEAVIPLGAGRVVVGERQGHLQFGVIKVIKSYSFCTG